MWSSSQHQTHTLSFLHCYLPTFIINIQKNLIVIIDILRLTCFSNEHKCFVLNSNIIVDGYLYNEIRIVNNDNNFNNKNAFLLPNPFMSILHIWQSSLFFLAAPMLFVFFFPKKQMKRVKNNIFSSFYPIAFNSYPHSQILVFIPNATTINVTVISSQVIIKNNVLDLIFHVSLFFCLL